MSDGGTTSRVFGSFITWMQEKQNPVFVIATANDVTALPPELLRKGRFDEIFFVDLPNERERTDVFRIHLALHRRSPAAFDLGQLAIASRGFSGAEIEEAIVASLFEAFATRSELKTEHVLKALGETVPLSRTMETEIERLRAWAAGRTRPSSSAPDLPPVAARRRL